MDRLTIKQKQESRLAVADAKRKLAERTCDHSRKLGGSQLPEGGWNGPVGRCACCLQTFGYIGSGSYTRGHTRTESPDTRLCRACGGKTHVFERRDGEVVRSEFV